MFFLKKMLLLRCLKKDTAEPEVNKSNVKIISIGIGAAVLFGAILFVVLRRNTKGMKSEEK